MQKLRYRNITTRLETFENIITHIHQHGHVVSLLTRTDIFTQMVIANRLDTRKTTVTLVTVDSEKKVQLTQDEIAEGIEIEERIVNAVVAKHKSSG